MPTNCHMQTGSKTHAELKKLTLISNVSLDINPPPSPPPVLANQTPAISSVPQALKNLISPPRQTGIPDNSNVLYMFNNNTYTDFRTAYKHVLIPNYFSQVT